MADRGSSTPSSGKGERISQHQIYNSSGLKQPPLGKTNSQMNANLSSKGKHTKNNAVHRTTSESLRLEAGNHLHHQTLHDRLSSGSASSAGSTIGPGSTISSMMAAGASSSSLASSSSSGGSGPILRSASQSSGSGKPKTSSFQITSVVTIGSGGGGPRISSNSNDNGDDSADDLDESHAEDKSVITDETPSFSEDTFSKEDVFFTSSDAIGSAPVIPTSSQYGLAIVAPNLSGPGGQNMADVHVSVTDAGINLMTNSKKDVDLKEIHHRNERFKVVKIESTEPFRRGRWICMDYLDHSTLQPTLEEQQQQEVEGSPDTGMTHNEDPLSQDNDSQAMTQSVVEIQGDLDSGMAVDTEMVGAVGGTTTKSDESPGQSLQQPLNVSSTTPGKPTANINADTPQSNTTTTTSQASGNSSPQTNTVILASTNNTTSQNNNNFQQGQSQPAQYYSQQVLDQQITSQQQQQQQQPMLHHGATLPANILQAATSTTTSQNTQQQSPVLPQQLTVSVDTAATTFHQQQDSPQFIAAMSPQTQHQQQPDSSSSSTSNVMHNGPISVIEPPSTLPLNNNSSNTTTPNLISTNSQNVTQQQGSNETSTAGSVPASQQTEAVAIESNNPNDLNSVSAAASVSASAPNSSTTSNSTLISPSTMAASLQGHQGQSLPQQLIQNIVAEDGSAEDSER